MTFINKLFRLFKKSDEWFDEILTFSAAGEKPAPIFKKVHLIIFNPRIPSVGNIRLHEAMGWNNPDVLTRNFIKDLHVASFGFVNYEVVSREEVDTFPVKIDGFEYEAEAFVQAWRSQGRQVPFHKPDWADYYRIMKDFDMIDRINSGAADEFWMFGFPYAGFYESRMAGSNAFWCNAPALNNTAAAERRFVIMGFSYERGVGEMLENMGHRAESILKHVFRQKTGGQNLWERFIRYDQTHPDKAEVGLMHFAPNSTRDYEWGRKEKVLSRAHTWLNFPELAGEPKLVNCNAWGRGDIRLHHLWWFKHLPHTVGESDGISHNWWRYIIDPELV